MSLPGVDVCCLLLISITLNVTGACCAVLETLRDRASRAKLAAVEAQHPSNRPERIAMYRVVDLVTSQALALYALFLLLWLPLLEESFQHASPAVIRYTLPAICVSIGRHLFCVLRGWRSGRSAIPSLAHAVAAVCYLLFLQTSTNLVFAALAMLTELGNLYLHVTAILGERRAAALPVWTAGLGVILTVIFNGLCYLIVLALALARRSPMTMSPLAVGVFFFYITFSFIMNTYSIYLVMAAFFSNVLEARVGAMLQMNSQARLASVQALDNMRTSSANVREEVETASAAPDTVKYSDGDLLINNMV